MEGGKDGDGGDGKLENEVKKKKKKEKEKEKKRTAKEVAEDVEEAKGGKRELGNEGVGEKVSSKDEKGESMKKQRGDENGNKEGWAVVSLSGSEGNRVEEDEEDARMASKKQRVEKKEEAKLPNGDDNVRTDCKSNGTVSESNPSVVLCLSTSLQKSRRDSLNMKKREKAQDDGKKLGERKDEGKKWNSKFDATLTSSSEEGGVKNAKIGNGAGGSGLKKKKTSGEKADEKESKSCCLPLNRVRTIVRSDNSNIRITQESYFLICMATECFIEQFCEDAFSLAASHGLKKLLKYEHLASLVYNMDRYDFLSDYVPQKIKAKDALAEAKAAEARQA